MKLYLVWENYIEYAVLRHIADSSKKAKKVVKSLRTALSYTDIDKFFITEEMLNEDIISNCR